MLRWRRIGREVRLFYAQAMDSTWQAPCDEVDPAECHHGRASELLEDSARECVMGGWEEEGRRRKMKRLEGPLDNALSDLGGDVIIIRRLSPAIRALNMAANSSNCCKARAEELFAALIAAHWRFFFPSRTPISPLSGFPGSKFS